MIRNNNRNNRAATPHCDLINPSASRTVSARIAAGCAILAGINLGETQ